MSRRERVELERGTTKRRGSGRNAILSMKQRDEGAQKLQFPDVVCYNTGFCKEVDGAPAGFQRPHKKMHQLLECRV